MFFLFDIGGTKMRLAISHQEDIINERILPTPQNFDEAIATISTYINEMKAGAVITAAAGGLPGPITRDRTGISNAPNLTAWNNRPFVPELKKVLEVPIYLHNDAALAGLGEAVYGAGQGYEIVAYMTISTGIGGVRIVNKKIDHNSYGFEPGHQYIDFDKSTFADAQFGTLEKYASGNSIKHRYNAEPEDLEDEKMWKSMETVIAYGLNNTIVHWSPDVVVLGGGLINSDTLSVENISQKLEEVLYIFSDAPVIRKSVLGDKCGLMGALALIKSKS
ncbi:ROK family protein [candidate division WWE3 bacterium]|uniref:ROK family protein n=1 Tax=candidate division WWE3 bacterium TaxID=2053526 RepID=A0A955LGJ2_UNCKA|nr:ROK family protein [candidate division WWE3 bacterium]